MNKSISGTQEAAHHECQKRKQTADKVAVCIFQKRICPRFDISCEILIFDLDGPPNLPERIDASTLSPEQRIDLLQKKDIQVVIVGGIQERFQQMFNLYQIKVIWGVIGEAEGVLQAYRQGNLHTGSVILPSRASAPRRATQGKEEIVADMQPDLENKGKSFIG